MHRVALWTILSIATLLRLGLLAAGLANQGALLTPDSDDYVANASTLAWQGRFARGADAPPDLERTPGYPLLLAGAVRLAGSPTAPPEALSPAALRLVLLGQVLLDVGLVYLTYRLGRHLAGAPAGLVAAAFQASSAVVIAASTRVLSDSMFAFMLTGTLLVALAAMRRRSWALAALAGGLLAAATYVRPIGLLVPAPILMVWLIQRHWRLAVAMAGAFVLAVVPWIVRNAVVAEYPHFSAMPAVNLWQYEALAVRAHLSSTSEAELRQSTRAQLDERFGPTPSAESYHWQAQQGRRVLLDHPALAMGLHLRASLTSLLPGVTDALEVAGLTSGQRGTLAVLRQRGLGAAIDHYFGGRRWLLWLVVPAGLLLAGLYAGALLAPRRAHDWRIPAPVWVLILVGLYLLLAPGPAAHPRFRVPMMPLLSVAAGAGWSTLRRPR